MQSFIPKLVNLCACGVVGALALLATAAVASADFVDDLERVDKALKKNPSAVLPQAIDSCITRRRFAIQLYNGGHEERARRSLSYCFHLLAIPEKAPQPKVVTRKPEDLQAKAQRELDKALTLKPDLVNGLKIYRECAACHTPEGFGLSNGSVPQIAGQHRKVVIKQLADIRAGNRDNVLMVPYSSAESIGGAQAVGDVAAYIDTLEIDVATGKGKGEDLELGERLYKENCVRCHGATGEGDDERFMPRIQAQHYNYLVRQFEWIRDGERRNANPEMVEQIQGFDDRQTRALADYVSRLEPPEDLRAPADWRNPDFAN
jgi:cytochrome c553